MAANIRPRVSSANLMDKIPQLSINYTLHQLSFLHFNEVVALFVCKNLKRLSFIPNFWSVLMEWRVLRSRPERVTSIKEEKSDEKCLTSWASGRACSRNLLLLLCLKTIPLKLYRNRLVCCSFKNKNVTL